MSSQPITIHQFHYSAAGGDAVTHHMLLIREALREAGIDGRIFVGSNQAPTKFGIETFDRNEMWDGDLLLVHHSHGNPLQKELLRAEIPLALIYHNVTPASFFAHDPHLAKFSLEGRAQLLRYASRAVTSFGVSRYNCAELKALGFSDVKTLPLLDLKPLSALPEDRAKEIFARRKHELLFVGRVTPHKNQALLLHMLFYLREAFGDKYTLRLVGKIDPIYGRYLKGLAKSLGVEVDFVGGVTTQQLTEAYPRASALVCPSLHEGFCVPLVEAMQADLPILALPLTGVRETLGDCGVQLVAREPAILAHAAHALLSDAEALKSILQGQRQRYEQLRTFQSREQIVSLCKEVVHHRRTGAPPTHLEAHR